MLAKKNVWVGGPSYFDFGGPETICANNLYQFNIISNNNNDQATYSWSSSSPNLNVSGVGPSVNVSGCCSGTYFLNATAQNVCGTNSNSLGVTVTQCFGRYAVYPNPAKDQVSIKFDDFSEASALPDEIALLSENSTKPLRVVNVQEAYDRKTLKNGDTVEFDVRDLPRGTYYLHVKNSRRNDKEVDAIRILLE